VCIEVLAYRGDASKPRPAILSRDGDLLAPCRRRSEFDNGHDRADNSSL
jgi:hypothetical protein